MYWLAIFVELLRAKGIKVDFEDDDCIVINCIGNHQVSEIFSILCEFGNEYFPQIKIINQETEMYWLLPSAR